MCGVSMNSSLLFRLCLYSHSTSVSINDQQYTHLYPHSVLCHYSWSNVYPFVCTLRAVSLFMIQCIPFVCTLRAVPVHTLCAVSVFMIHCMLICIHTVRCQYPWCILYPSVSTLYGVSIHDAYYTHLYPHCTVSVSMMHTIPICIHTPVCTQTPCCQNPWSIIYPFLSTLQSVSVVTLRAVSESMIHNIPTRIHTPACSSVLTPGWIGIHAPCFICQCPRSMLYMSVSTPHLL